MPETTAPANVYVTGTVCGMTSFLLKTSTAPVLLADSVTTGNGLKMVSTAAYNLLDNHRYSIANFNFK